MVSLSQMGFGQEEKSQDEVYTTVEVSPQFEGGKEGFEAYIKENFKYPKDARILGKEGQLYVLFVIDKEGAVVQESVKVIRPLHFSIDNEAERVIKASPKWTPGKLKVDGPPVNVKLIIPLNFNL